MNPVKKKRGPKPSMATDSKIEVKEEVVPVKSTMDMEKTAKVEKKAPKKQASSVTKIKLVNPNKVYFDIYTQEMYVGEKALPVKKMSHFIIMNAAGSKEEAIELGLPFYRV